MSADKSAPMAGIVDGTPWLPLGDGWGMRNAESQLADSAAMLQLYKGGSRCAAASPRPKPPIAREHLTDKPA
ncbi:hypothetical protein [Variovorax paradoxus]|uniref:hypothetical protein n=1 Tax=Variovorax paradoxus TaxID=34073 RepID=UPI0018852FD5|nr:hypothetical protein [Variovorax paradoxus]